MNKTSTTTPEYDQNTFTPNVIVCIIAILFLVLCGAVGYVVHCIKKYRTTKKNQQQEDSTSMETDESFEEK
jgi:flagellar basal body-associated protein FliL